MAKIKRWHFGPSGGSGGRKRVDPAKDLHKPVPREFNVNSGWYIDRVEVRVVDLAKSNSHLHRSSFGGPGGNKVSFTLDDDEYITDVFGTYDRFLVTLGIRTSKGRKKAWGGGNGQGRAQFEYAVPSGYYICEFSGRSGVLVDAIGVGVARISDL
jgi:hypothetical protein